MRRLIWLGACALSMLHAATAFADVREAPLRVQWLGPPPALEAGKPVTGTLQFVSSTPVSITNVRLEGAGWSSRLLDTPPRMSLARAGRLQARFEATGSDISQPLVLRFEADGVAKEETLDFRALVESAKPGGVKRVPEHYDPFRSRAGDFARPGAEAEEDALQVRGKADRLVAEPAAPSAVTARNIRVYGRFTYTRSDGVLMGADGVAVRIYDEDTGSDELLATVATDAYGYYDVTFYWDPCAIFCDSQPDIYVEFKSSNSEINVRTTGIFGGTYAWASGTTNDYTGTSLNIGWLTPSDEGTHPALHILTDLTRDWRWYLNNEGYNLPSINAYWPDGASGAYYDKDDPGIHIGEDRRWREDTHAHEYGHHWIYTYAVGQTPDYCNGICDGATCGHCMWCRETNHDAWNEGWPNWIAHVQTTSYAGDYGTASMNTRNMETVDTCSGTLHDPTITEGFLGALLQDLWDSANEDDPVAPGTWRDQLALGYDEIFTVTDLDHPLNPLDFIAKFKARYPSYKEQLWETAKNCTYEVDAANPSVVTGLTSPSHPVGSDSPDPTVQFNWTRANDDWSGPSGYSITVQATASLPDQTQDILDVTTWTSGVLAPGTYRFNIRTRDRSGKWSSSYATYGPFTIRTPEPANLTYTQFAGWAHETVPRSAPDATFGSVPNPAAPLASGTATTYWNLGGRNTGESSTSVGFTSRCYVDDVYKTGASWGAIGAGGGFYATNWGPFTVQGGRHTMETRYDALDAIAETNESDNEWAHQWIWEPVLLAANTNTTRAAPPAGTAGWGSIVDGSPLWFNADGLRFSTNLSGQWWHAVYQYATNLAEDYDCRLHFATSSADTGFAGNHGYSARGAGYLDAVMVNRNMVFSPSLWDVGVLNNGGGSGNYVARQVTSSHVNFGDSVNVTLGDGEMMLLREFYLFAADTGDISITAKIVAGTGPVYLQWRDRDFRLGDLSDYNAEAAALGATTARVDVHTGKVGWHGICLYRNPLDGTSPVTVVLEISRTPPDFMPYFAAGWHAPFVPRPAFDGTPASVPLPDTLHGNTSSTYLNFAVRNDSPTGETGLLAQVYLDGIYTWWLSYGFFGGYLNSLFNWNAAWTVRGGRHTLSVNYDQVQAIEEKYEDNNVYGEQYAWSPYALSLGTPVTRSAPPDRTGGWGDITSGEVIWYNSDGLRMPRTPPSAGNNYWQAVVVMPGASSDVDVRLHDLSPGTKNAFGSNHGVSSWGTGQSDYCLVDFNTVSAMAQDAGVLRVNGTQNYTAEFVGSVYRGSSPNGLFGPYTLAANRLLHLHEFYLAAGTYAVDVFNESGTVDWGVTVHPTATTFQTKSTAVPGGASWFGGPGVSELCTATIPAAGYHCVAVWKAGAADLAQTGSYRLQLRPLTVDVAAGLPQRTALGATYPNPLGAQASIAFDLAAEGDVRLELYDLHGARVKTLASGRWNAGRWQVRWLGDDDSGRDVPPGVYFVRLLSQGASHSRRIVKTE